MAAPRSAYNPPISEVWPSITQTSGTGDRTGWPRDESGRSWGPQSRSLCKMVVSRRRYRRKPKAKLKPRVYYFDYVGRLKKLRELRAKRKRQFRALKQRQAFRWKYTAPVRKTYKRLPRELQALIRLFAGLKK